MLCTLLGLSLGHIIETIEACFCSVASLPGNCHVARITLSYVNSRHVHKLSTFYGDWPTDQIKSI